MQYNRIRNYICKVKTMNSGIGWMQKLKMSMAHFMAGRYGNDKLNMVILGVGLAASLISVFVQNSVLLNLIFFFLSYGLMFWAFFRLLSRNTYKRYQENRKFLQFVGRIKDRDNRYFDCPKCRQMVRVPRGKGKISITCPRCREKFIRKT